LQKQTKILQQYKCSCDIFFIILLVIAAQIATQENLENISTVVFPPLDSSTNSTFMMFGNMTAMIQIPSTAIINQITKEGI